MTTFSTVQDPTQLFQTFVKQAQQGTQTWFKLVNGALEESDKQFGDAFKWAGAAHENLISVRKNALKFAEETTERSFALTESALSVWSAK